MQLRNPYKSLVVFGVVAVILTLAYAVGQAWAQPPKPQKAPSALLKARQACPIGKPLKCRAALMHAYAATAWQKKQRAGTSRDVVLDAIAWASEKTGVPVAQMIGIGTCESHLFWLAENGQFKSWAQLSARHRRDPLIARMTWRDPYAVALHVARYIRRFGEGEWQCRSTGGLRW